MVLLDTTGGATRQLLYEQDAAANSINAVAALPDGDLLVIEHDALMPGAATQPSWCKRIYRVSLAGATDITGDARAPDGLLLDGRAPEIRSRSAIEALGVAPVQKRLVLDLLAIDYPHDKPEGLALLDDPTLAIVNDDDFGVVSDGTGGIVEKRLARSVDRDSTELWVVNFDEPLF